MLKQQEALSTELWLATKWFLFCWYYFKNCSLLALALLFTRKDGHLQIVDMMQHALMRNWSWDTYSSLNIPILSNFTNPLFERICNWLPPRACRLISWLCMWGNWGPGWFLPVCKAALVPSQGQWLVWSARWSIPTLANFRKLVLEVQRAPGAAFWCWPMASLTSAWIDGCVQQDWAIIGQS